MIKINGRLVAGLALSLATVGALLWSGPARATENEDDISAGYVSNSYIMHVLGLAGAWMPDEEPGHCYDTNLPISGRVEIWRVAGNPMIAGDNGKPMLFRHPWAGSASSSNYPDAGGPCDRINYWGIAVDEATDEGTWYSFAAGGNYGILGSEQNGWWNLFPYVPDNRKIIKATTIPYSNVEAALDIQLVHDAVRYKWTITNYDGSTHWVGLKFVGDVIAGTSGYSTSDVSPFAWADGSPVLLTSTLYSGSDVPNELEFIDDVQNPVCTTRFTFGGNGATKPAQVGIDDWGIVSSDAFGYYYRDYWAYEPVPHYPYFANDIALGACWKPVALAPGKSTEVVMYVGCADATTKMDIPSVDDTQYSATVQGPRTLTYNDNDGLDSPYGENPFTITAFLDSLITTFPITEARATLTLPEGLKLADSENGAYRKFFNDIGSLNTESVSWKVVPDGTTSGTLTYSVDFTADPVGSTTVSRSIRIPATVKTPITQKWQMMSLPFNTAVTEGTDVSTLSGGQLSMMGLSGVYGTDWKVWAYDPSTKSYYQPDTLTPGLGYWLYMKGSDQTSSSATSAWTYTPLTWSYSYGGEGTRIPLTKGWNLIGNPYLYGLAIGECSFYSAAYGTLTYDEAMEKSLINKTVYWYNTDDKEYDMSSDRATMLEPWKGYWIKALQKDVSIIITPESQIGASVTTTGSAAGEDTPPPAP